MCSYLYSVQVTAQLHITCITCTCTCVNCAVKLHKLCTVGKYVSWLPQFWEYIKIALLPGSFGQQLFFHKPFLPQNAFLDKFAITIINMIINIIIIKIMTMTHLLLKFPTLQLPSVEPQNSLIWRMLNLKCFNFRKILIFLFPKTLYN